MSAAAVDPLFDPEVNEHPHEYYAQLRTTDPVHRIPGTNTFLVTRMDLIHEVVAKTGVYSSVSAKFLHVHGNGDAPGLRGVGPGAEDIDLESAGQVLATADPPDHGRQRKV